MSFRYFLQENKVKEEAPKLSAKEAFRGFVYDSKFYLFTYLFIYLFIFHNFICTNDRKYINHSFKTEILLKVALNNINPLLKLKNPNGKCYSSSSNSGIYKTYLSTTNSILSKK